MKSSDDSQITSLKDKVQDIFKISNIDSNSHLPQFNDEKLTQSLLRSRAVSSFTPNDNKNIMRR